MLDNQDNQSENHLKIKSLKELHHVFLPRYDESDSSRMIRPSTISIVPISFDRALIASSISI